MSSTPTSGSPRTSARLSRIGLAAAAGIAAVGLCAGPAAAAVTAPAPAHTTVSAPAPAHFSIAKPAPAHASAAAPAKRGSPVANALDSRMTVKNSTMWPMTVWMGSGTASDVPTQMTVLLPGQSTYMQGWSYLPHGKDVQATIDYSASPLGSSDRVKVSAENPSAGWPSLQVEGYDQDNLAAGETVTRTVRDHTLELHRNTDLPDAKDLVVTVTS